jgi:ABC-type polysaccharide/polyol phosphate transport system ATPase subunit
VSAISLEGVGKRYVQSVERPMLVKSLLGLHRRHRKTIWALRNLSMSCEAGQTLGIIGRNGSGKTTLLKLLAGVSAPTEGRLRIEGRIAPLIGVGVGFNPELTGTENVNVNGQLLGLTEREVNERYDAIVDFAEMGEFMDTPVKYYSSGMFLRLAFSVAIHTEPDIFLIDEVLAVGDAAFQLKCLERIRRAQDRGTAVIVATHNLAMLQQLAPRAILLSRGEVAFDGDVDEALNQYQSAMQAEAIENAISGAAGSGGTIGGARVDLEIDDDTTTGSGGGVFATGSNIRIKITATFGREVEQPRVGLLIATIDRGEIFTVHTHPGDYAGSHGPDQPLHAEFGLTNHLIARTYLVQAAVYESTGDAVVGISAPTQLTVTATHRIAGLVDLEPRISIEGQSIAVRPVERLASGESAPRGT